MEVGRHPETIAFRDSKDPHGPHLHIAPATFQTLIKNLKR
ncbi:DUF397 domain-containing protein [Actinomadura syzygii]